jgi:hypothetical protein
MKTNRLRDSLLSLFTVLLVYALAFSLSLWREAARRSFVTTMTGGPILFIIQIIAILLIMATSLMLLNWFLNQKMRPNVLVACILFITGCILLAAPFFDLRLMPIPFPAFLQHNYPGALLSYATVFISIIGIIGLIRSLRSRNQETYSGEPDKGFLKNNRVFEWVLSLFAVLLMLAIAYGLGFLREAARISLMRAFKFHLLVVSMAAIHAGLMTCFIALNWLINSKIRPKAVVSWIIFLSGCLPLLFSLVLQLVTKVPSFPNQLFLMTLLSIACAFIAVIGGMRLFIIRN